MSNGPPPPVTQLSQQVSVDKLPDGDGTKVFRMVRQTPCHWQSSLVRIMELISQFSRHGAFVIASITAAIT